MLRLLLPALLLAACNFDTSTSAGTGGPIDADLFAPDADPNAPDADPNAPDANPNAPDANPNAPDAQVIAFCGWEYDPVYFDPCMDPSATLNPLNLDMANDPMNGEPPYIYNTNGAGTLSDPMGNFVTHTSTVVGTNRILWTSSFNIASAARLRVIGDMPLVIASKSTIDIDGALSVASLFPSDTLVAREGAGTEPLACATTPAAPGESCSHGGAGGGGGAFSGDGGKGGNAAVGRDCAGAAGTGSVGGTGGGLAAIPAILRGGCAGGRGGEGDGTDKFGIGGPGGGAVHLTAVTTLRVTGRIHAGGAGGRKATGNRAAGGGGGSGGMIGLEAATIELTGGVISANGGGGGGGGNGAGALDGDDALPTGAQAEGGDPENQGTKGGDGGWVDDANGASVPGQAERGGGGGGGGAGYILTYQDSTPTLGATISPLAIAVP
jgi:hypothetical protein